MVFDTDVLVWMLRGSSKAVREIDAAEVPEFSVATYMELVEGARDRAELRSIRDTVARFDLSVLPLSEAIGHRAAIYMDEYRLESGLDLVDALVAATAIENGRTLCTGNVKHFRAIPGLSVKAFRP